LKPAILMTDPAHYDVRYEINPWMRPAEWTPEHLSSAIRAWQDLKRALERAGADVSVIESTPGWPDMVFAANLAVVFDRKFVLARFRHEERRGEEAHFRAALGARADKEIISLPPGMIQEGAGDFIWDVTRRIFWAGYGQRSDRSAALWIGDVLGAETVPLELASPRFYHLDTCFCPLSGGEVLYYPPAFTDDALRAIRARVAPQALIEADAQAAAAFCINAVNLGRTIVMSKAPRSWRAILAGRGYKIEEVDLAPFILSGGAAFCLTLRLDNAHVTASLEAATG